jgi:hypothetical protein
MPSGSSTYISINPQGSATGSRTILAPAAASRACSARRLRTWIQIITERPRGPAACPETSSNPWRGRTPFRDRPAGSSGLHPHYIGADGGPSRVQEGLCRPGRDGNGTRDRRALPGVPGSRTQPHRILRAGRAPGPGRDAVFLGRRSIGCVCTRFARL